MTFASLVAIYGWKKIHQGRQRNLLIASRIEAAATNVNYYCTNNFRFRLSCRQQVIARLPKLHILNGTQIDPIERQDAERSFLRFYYNTEIPPTRYKELVEKHGLLTPLLELELTAPKTVDIQLSYGDVKCRPYKLNVR